MGDTEKIIKCPACGNEMQKIFIADKGINIDICANGCGGIFFDNKEIQEFSEKDADISEIKQALSNKNFMPVDETKTRICPACGTPMAKTRAFGVQIDTCYKCGGLFLDNGEFEIVRSKFSKSKKVVPVEYKPNNNDIDVERFYKEAQDEEIANEYGREKARDLLYINRSPMGLLYLLFRLFL